MLFRFYKAKVLDCALLVQGGPSDRLAGKKSSSLRSGIFFRQALPPKCANPKWEACKIGKNHPDGIYSFLKIKNMKLLFIKNIARLAVTGFLLIGIILLWNKGIVPVYTIALLLTTGGLISWLFRIIRLAIKLLAIAAILAILV